MAARKSRPSTPATPGCSVKGCRRAVHARGLCEPHWEDLARSRGPFAPARPEPGPAAGSPLKSGRPEPP